MGDKAKRSDKAAQRAVVASQWRPIDTAPNDGTHVLTYWPRHRYDEDDNLDESIDLGGAIAVSFLSGRDWVEPDYLDAIGSRYDDEDAYAPNPTHWMPLPEPPQTASGL